MKRYLVSFTVWALLALPLVVAAQPTTIPPEANWTPTPPARGTGAAVQKEEVAAPSETGQFRSTTLVGQSRETDGEPDPSLRTSP